MIRCLIKQLFVCCFFQAEDGIRDLVRSRGLGDVYKRQEEDHPAVARPGYRAHGMQPTFAHSGVIFSGDHTLSLIHI